MVSRAAWSTHRDSHGIVAVGADPGHQAGAHTLAARVALDMYYDQHLSPPTIKLLRRNGVRVKALRGVAIWTDAQRAKQRRQRHRKPSGDWLEAINNALHPNG